MAGWLPIRLRLPGYDADVVHDAWVNPPGNTVGAVLKCPVMDPHLKKGEFEECPVDTSITCMACVTMART